MNNWLEPELQGGLREVTAPADLWDRVQAARVAPARPLSSVPSRRLIWAMAATVVLAAVGLSILRAHRDSAAGDEALALQALSIDSQRVAFHCENPTQLRAWVKAKTGLDVPLRSEPAASIEFIGASSTVDRAEIAYRAGNRGGVLLISRADRAADVAHGHASGNVSSWVAAGQRFTLASDNPADLQVACKLCHLD
jgi:hypothetical protein